MNDLSTLVASFLSHSTLQHYALHALNPLPESLHLLLSKIPARIGRSIRFRIRVRPVLCFPIAIAGATAPLDLVIAGGRNHLMTFPPFLPVWSIRSGCCRAVGNRFFCILDRVFDPALVDPCVASVK